MELLTRVLTSIVLLALMISILLFFTPMLMAITIALIYSYAFCAEYIPLAHKSFTKIPIINVITGIALIVTGMLHVIWIYNPHTHFNLFICIVAAVLSDIGGYIVGKLFGKNLLAPSISPKKTWEGLAGSIIITGGLFSGIGDPYLGFLFGAILAVAGLCGDLLFSYIKRAAGVKDTGTILPGHGGILDRIDSIVGTTTIFVLILLLLKASNQINLLY